jgi:hypothetical protein
LDCIARNFRELSACSHKTIACIRAFLSQLAKSHPVDVLKTPLVRRQDFRFSGTPFLRKAPENQEVADWVCAGLDILRLVCVGVFTALCAVTDAAGSVA